MIRTTIFLFILFAGLQCHAQRINTPTGYEYHDRYFSVHVDTLQKQIGVIMYFRGKHWVTIKNGAYAVSNSRIYFGKRYSWKYEGQAQAVSIEIKGKRTDLRYRIK